MLLHQVGMSEQCLKTWSLKRSANYGSKHSDEKPAKVTSVTVSEDGKSVTLQIAEMRPTWCMEIQYNVKAVDGSIVRGVVHNTVHRLGE